MFHTEAKDVFDWELISRSLLVKDRVETEFVGATKRSNLIRGLGELTMLFHVLICVKGSYK